MAAGTLLIALLFGVSSVHAVPGGRAPDENEAGAPDVQEITEPESEERLPIDRIEARPLTAVDARSAALLLSGETGGDFEGAVLWTSPGPAAGDEQVSVQVFVEVDGSGLLAGSAGSRQTIEVFFYVVNESGDVEGHLAQSMVLDGSKYVERVRETGLRYVGDFKVARGLYSIRTLVRNRGTMKYFLASRDFDLRFDESSAPILLPPLVKERADVWVIAGEQSLLVPSILQGFPGMDVWPSAVPVRRAGERIEMVVGCSELTAGRNLSARLVDHSGSQLFNLDLEIGAGVAAGSDLTFYELPWLLQSCRMGDIDSTSP